MNYIRKNIASVFIIISFMAMVGVYLYLIGVPGSGEKPAGEYEEYYYITESGPEKPGGRRAVTGNIGQLAEILRKEEKTGAAVSEGTEDKKTETPSGGSEGYIFLLKHPGMDKDVGDDEKKDSKFKGIVYKLKVPSDVVEKSGKTFTGQVFVIKETDDKINRGNEKTFKGDILKISQETRKVRYHPMVIVPHKTDESASFKVDKPFTGVVYVLQKPETRLTAASGKYRGSILTIENPDKKIREHKHVSIPHRKVVPQMPGEDDSFKGIVYKVPSEYPLLDEAEELIKKGSLKKAEKLLNTSQDLPKARILMTKGDICRIRGDFKNALRYYRQSKKEDHANKEISRKISSLLLVLDDSEGALRESREMDADQIFQAEILLQMAAENKLKDNRQWREQVSDAVSAVESMQYKDAPEIPALLGKARFLLEDYDGAGSYFDKAVGNGNLNEVYRVDLLMALSKIYLDRGDVSKASEYNDGIIEITGKWDPDSYEKGMLTREYAVLLKRVFTESPVTPEQVLSGLDFYRRLESEEIGIKGLNPRHKIEIMSEIVKGPGEEEKQAREKLARDFLKSLNKPEYPQFFEEKVIYNPLRNMLGNLVVADTCNHYGDYAAAEQFYRRALSFSPGNPVIEQRILNLTAQDDSN